MCTFFLEKIKTIKKTSLNAWFKGQSWLKILLFFFEIAHKIRECIARPNFCNTQYSNLHVKLMISFNLRPERSREGQLEVYKIH